MTRSVEKGVESVESVREATMTRIQRHATTVSWIPSESVAMAWMRLPFNTGVMHFDPAPPLQLEDLETMQGEGNSGSPT